LFAWSVLTSAFQRFTCEHCLQIVGLNIRIVTLNRFPIWNCWCIQTLHLSGD